MQISIVLLRTKQQCCSGLDIGTSLQHVSYHTLPDIWEHSRQCLYVCLSLYELSLSAEPFRRVGPRRASRSCYHLFFVDLRSFRRLSLSCLGQDPVRTPDKHTIAQPRLHPGLAKYLDAMRNAPALELEEIRPIEVTGMEPNHRGEQRWWELRNCELCGEYIHPYLVTEIQAEYLHLVGLRYESNVLIQNAEDYSNWA